MDRIAGLQSLTGIMHRPLQRRFTAVPGAFDSSRFYDRQLTRFLFQERVFYLEKTIKFINPEIKDKGIIL